MGRSFWRAAWVVLALLVSAGAQAQIDDATAERLLRLSGQWSQLDSLGRQLKDSLLQGLSTGDKPMPPAQQQQVRAAAERAFTADRMRAAAKRTLVQNVRAAYVPEIVRWYETPAAGRVTRAEEEDTAAEQPEPAARTRIGMAVLQASSEHRQALLARAVDVMRAGQSGADTVINLGVWVPLALARFAPAGPRPVEAELRAALEAQRAQLQPTFEALSLASFAIIYQPVPDDEFEAYLAFLSGAAGDHFGDVAERATQAAVAAAFAALVP